MEARAVPSERPEWYFFLSVLRLDNHFLTLWSRELPTMPAEEAYLEGKVFGPRIPGHESHEDITSSYTASKNS